MQTYARQRIAALDAGLVGVNSVPLPPTSRSLRELVRNNIASAKAIYSQVAALPADAAPASTAAVFRSAGQLVVETAVALIDYGATSCAPPADEPAAPPGQGAGRLLAVKPTAVITVNDPLLDNKSIIADRHAVWVAVARAPAVVRIDPKTNAVVARVPVPSHITQQIQLIDGKVWIPTDTDLVRIDEATNRIDWQIGLESLAPPDSAFTVHGVLHRIDIPSRRRAPDVPLPGSCQSVTSAGHHVTVAAGIPNHGIVISRIDATTGALGARIHVPASSVWGMLEAPDGRVFVDASSDSNRLEELDVDHGRVVHSILRDGTEGNQLAFADGALWVTRPDEQRLVRYDLTTGRLEEVQAGPGVNGVAVAGGSATNSDAGTVARYEAAPEPNGP